MQLSYMGHLAVDGSNQDLYESCIAALLHAKGGPPSFEGFDSLLEICLTAPDKNCYDLYLLLNGLLKFSLDREQILRLLLGTSRILPPTGANLKNQHPFELIYRILGDGFSAFPKRRDEAIAYWRAAQNFTPLESQITLIMLGHAARAARKRWIGWLGTKPGMPYVWPIKLLTFLGKELSRLAFTTPIALLIQTV